MKISGLENTTQGLRDVKVQLEIQIEKLKNNINNIDKSIDSKLAEIEELKNSKLEKNNTLETKLEDLETLKVAIHNLEVLSGEDNAKEIKDEPVEEESNTSVQNIEEDK